jgi:predicted esterase
MDSTLKPISVLGSRFFFTVPALLTAIWATLGPVRAEESDTFKAYQANWSKAQKAYSDKQYEMASEFYGKVAELLPFEPMTRYQIACCNACLGDTDKAFEALETAIRFGWDDTRRLEQAEELKHLRPDPRFARLVEAAVACAEESTVIYTGKGVDAGKRAPLVVLLQGLGCGPRGDVPYWKPAADKHGLILVAPRAPTKAGPLMYGWHRRGAKDSSADDYFDMAAAEKRIDESVKIATERFTIDKKRVLLAGFSQGGGVAFRMLRDHPENYCGVVAICSLCQPLGVAAWQSVAQQHPIRVFAMAGKFDPLLPRTQQAVEQLRAAKVMVRYEEMEREGHEYPPDYQERLARAIEFVVNPECR